VNYTFFDSGYLVVDLAASTFSSVIVLTDPNTFSYYQTAGLVAGNYQTLLDYSSVGNAVMFGTSSGSTMPPCKSSAPSNRTATSVADNGRTWQENSRATSWPVALKRTPPPPTARPHHSNTAMRDSARPQPPTIQTFTERANGQGLASSDALNLIGQMLSNRGIPGYSPTPTPTPTPTP
jgi:hypothetical protein